MKESLTLLGVCSIPMILFFSWLALVRQSPAQETLPKVGETTAEKADGKVPVVRGDCYLLARSARQARDKATAARIASDDANKHVDDAKASLAAAEKSAGEINAAADEADKDAAAQEATAKQVIAECLEKVRQSELLLGIGRSAKVKAASKGDQ